MSHEFSTNLKRFPIFKKILNSLSWEKNSLINQFISAKEHIYFSLICPIVQNKKTPIKIQCNHANNSRLRNLFVRILFLLLFNGDRGMKSLKENSCCGFVVAVLQSCVAWIFFFQMFKKAHCEISTTDFLTTWLIWRIVDVSQ